MRENNRIYELMNETVTLSDDSAEELTPLEKDRIWSDIQDKVREKKDLGKKRSSKINHKHWFAIAGAIVILLLGLTTPLGTKVYAVAENILDNLKISFSEITGRKDDVSHYATKGVGSTVEADGIQVKLDSLVVDTENNEILVLSLVDLNTPATEEEFGLFLDEYMIINGKKISTGDAVGRIKRVDEDNNIYSISKKYTMQEQLPKGKLDIRVVYSQILLMKNIQKMKPGESGLSREINEEIIFEIQANGKELAGETKTLNLNIDVKDEEFGSIQLEKLRMNPVTQKLYATWKMPKLPKGSTEQDYIDYMGQYSFTLRMVTDQGQQVEFESRKFSYFRKNEIDIVTMEYEFGNQGSEISPSEFFYGVERIEGQFTFDRYRSRNTGEKIESSQPFGETFTINLR